MYLDIPDITLQQQVAPYHDSGAVHVLLAIRDKV